MWLFFFLVCFYMLRFQVLEAGQPAATYPLRHPYLLGMDNVPIRGEITFDQGQVVCQKREAGVAALVLEQAVGDCGRLLMQTCLLPEREKPYLLSLELARHRLMLLYMKLEEWSMFELGQDHPVIKRLNQARGDFVEALGVYDDDPARAETIARDCLGAAVDIGEELALTHAELLLARRRAGGALPKRPVGCRMQLDQAIERVKPAVLSSFDFLYVSASWGGLVPQEGEYRWQSMDKWAQWSHRTRKPLLAGPIIQFQPPFVPDWLFIWEHDYETIRDMVYEHTEKVITRYRDRVAVWNVVSGLHVNSHFHLTLEQIMELTRLTTLQVKRAHPGAKALVEICQPFGEYYATNQRSIPPLMYADLVVQSGIAFDGFMVKLLMGQPASGMHSRDLMQVSHLLDQYASYGRPVTLVLGAPSGSQPGEADNAQQATSSGDLPDGYWRQPWSETVQARWLELVYKIALSKPWVEAVIWSEWTDSAENELPMAGLVNQTLQPKKALRSLASFRKQLLLGDQSPAPTASPQEGPAADPVTPTAKAKPPRDS